MRTTHENQLSVDRSSVHCASTENEIKNCVGIIPITVVGKEGRSLQTYALLDDGADKTLCDERTSRHSTNVGKEVNLDVKPMGGDHVIPLLRVWSIKKLPVSARLAARKADLSPFPYLSDLNIPRIETGDVMILIGTDNPIAHIPLEVRAGDVKNHTQSALTWDG